jgi:hypothetical protein
MNGNEAKDQNEVYEKALFGYWIDPNKRERGLVEKFGDIPHLFNVVNKRIFKLECMIHGIGALLLVPSLSALGIPTQAFLPYIAKIFMHSFSGLLGKI